MNHLAIRFEIALLKKSKSMLPNLRYIHITVVVNFLPPTHLVYGYYINMFMSKNIYKTIHRFGKRV